MQIKAIACELPATLGLPLSRLSTADIVREAQRCAIAATISDKTVWRWLNQDAIRPWRHRSWIFPRDPDFAVKAGRILDLYARQWQGRALKSDEFVISADEKTSIQARIRKHLSLPPRPAQAARIEHEYARAGAWAYMAALDVHRAKVFGRCEETTGIKPFDRLVAQVMANSPYRDARHVFWIVDNGSSHRGQPSVRRLQAAFPNLVLVHGPVHASWLNSWRSQAWWPALRYSWNAHGATCDASSYSGDVVVLGLLSGAVDDAEAVSLLGVVAPLVAAPPGALELSAAIIGVAIVATKTVAARPARMRFILQ